VFFDFVGEPSGADARVIQSLDQCGHCIAMRRIQVSAGVLIGFGVIKFFDQLLVIGFIGVRGVFDLRFP